MGKIAKVFEECKKQNRAALVIYICAGDPDLETTGDLLQALSDAGADVIELGVPFSDPTADGLAIQEASQRALKNGTTLSSIVALVKNKKSKITAPILLFGYYNPIFAYGEDRLIADAKDAGINGFLCVDLPPEAGTDFQQKVRKAGLDFVPLIAPTTNETRALQIADLASSFVYYVSMMGVTGSSSTDLQSASKKVLSLKTQIQKPIAIGFGIKTPEDVKTASKFADGVVVGSAVVRTIEAASTRKEAIEKTYAFVKSLRDALDH